MLYLICILISGPIGFAIGWLVCRLRTSSSALSHDSESNGANDYAALHSASQESLTALYQSYNLKIQSLTADLLKMQNSIKNFESSIQSLKKSIVSKAQQSKREELLSLNNSIQMKVEELSKISERLSTLRNYEQTAIKEKTKLLDDRNQIVLSQRAISEVKMLMGLCSNLSNPVALFKAVYDIYYKNAITSLIANADADGKCGIYRITNRSNGRIYVGQSVNIGDRWKQHCKRGSGCEGGTISGAKLYDAMLEEGLWNFTFDIIEEVNRADLTEHEKYWINFYNSTAFGYNMKG